MRTRWWVLPGIILSVLAAVLVAVPYPGNAQEPEQNVEPPSGRPSTLFHFYSKGFEGNEQVAFWFNAPNGKVYGNDLLYRVYSFQGRADWQWRSPDDALPGTWTAVAKGLSSDIKKVISFEIVPHAEAAPENAPSVPQANEAGVAVEPAVGAPGTIFSFYATDFDNDERVGYWFHAPDGHIDSNDSAYQTHAYQGRADWQWRSPGDAIVGTWVVVVQGVRSKITRVIQFEIRQNDQAAQGILPTNPPGVAVEPVSGVAGTRFFFMAAGFQPGETVTFWATAPDGSLYDKSKYTIVADLQGEAYWNWGTPPDAPSGIWMMKAIGEKSQTQKTIYFQIP